MLQIFLFFQIRSNNKYLKTFSLTDARSVSNNILWLPRTFLCLYIGRTQNLCFLLPLQVTWFLRRCRCRCLLIILIAIKSNNLLLTAAYIEYFYINKERKDMLKTLIWVLTRISWYPSTSQILGGVKDI